MMLNSTERLLLTLVAAVAVTPFLLASDASAAIGWRATGSLAVPRADHTATALRDGTVLVAGGRQQTTDPAPTASAELYYPATGAWITVGTMASTRADHTATLLDGPVCARAMPPTWCGKVLVAGGTTGPTSAELYDPKTRSFSPTGSLITPRRRHTATTLPDDGTVLVAGGETMTGTGTTSRLSSAELYDPAAGTWRPTGSLAEARAEHSAVLLPDGNALAAGGTADDADGRQVALASAEAYAPATGLWSSAGSLTIARYEATATLLPDGRPLFVGGLDTRFTPRRSTEIYAPSAPGGPWIDGGSMNVGRGRHTATALPDGTTLVTGGETAGIASTELYSAETATWSSAAPLATGRARHTATLLGGPRCASSCGDVLVVGGRRGITPLASAELYSPPPPSTTLTGPPGRVTDLSAKTLSARRIRLIFSAPGSVG
ncbi:MAG: kelch repeat-containing protein, partial [Solirubrobacteraceae bacterium]